MRRTKSSGVARVPGNILVALALVLFPGTAAAAHAAPLEFHEPMLDVPETGQAGLLSLTSSVHPLEIPWLEPGDTFSWQIGLQLTGQPIADGTLEFIPHGGLMHPDADYRLSAQRCETQWTGQSGTGGELGCSSGATTLLADSPLQLGPTARIPFGDVASTSPHILFSLSVPEEAAVAGPFTFALGFTVMGDEAARRSNLPMTGLAVGGSLAAAIVLLGAGLFARFSGRRVGKA
jgi:hypothetical protein